MSSSEFHSWLLLIFFLFYLKSSSSASIFRDMTCFSSLSNICEFSSVAQSCLTLQPHEPQHTRPLCPSPTPRVHPNPCPSSQWCHPTISSSVIPFSSHLQSLPTSGYFPMSQLFASGGQSIRVSTSTSVLPMNTQDWSPLGWTGWISCEALSKLSSPVTCQHFYKVYQFLYFYFYL